MGYVLALLVDRQVLYDNLLMHLRVELAEVIDGMSPEVFVFADENHVCHCSVRLSSPLIHVRTYAPPPSCTFAHGPHCEQQDLDLGLT